MDTQDFHNICSMQFRDEELIKEAHQFFNGYFGFKKHLFSNSDFEALCNYNFNLQLSTILWHSLNPKTEKEIDYYYRITPFDFMKNLYKCMDTIHLTIFKNTIEEFKKHNIKTILDYGGGSGYFCIKLKEAGFDVTFAEINKLSIEWIRYINDKKQLGIKIIDLYEEGLDGVYDALFIKDVLEHLKNPEGKIKYLRNFTRMLCIASPNCEGPDDYEPMHFRLKTNEWIDKYCGKMKEMSASTDLDILNMFQEKAKETEHNEHNESINNNL